VKFDLLCTVSTGEVHSTIDGKYYIYYIDAAFIPEFLRIHKFSPGKALHFLKEKARDYDKPTEEKII